MTAEPAPPVRRGVTFDEGTAFWMGIALIGVLFLTSAAPTPMYVVYQQRWHFSSATLTAVFAVYSVTVIAALTLLGHASDRLGRRRVLTSGLLLVLVGLTLFACARSLAWLFAARSVQGLGVGISSTALGAQVIEVQPKRSLNLAATATSMSSGLGMAIGALGAGLFIDDVADARHSLYIVLLALCASALVLGRGLPETVTSRTGNWVRWPPFVHAPVESHKIFALYCSGTVATWAIGGLYLSLGPSIAAQLLHSRSHMVGGLVVFELGIVGGFASLLARRGPRHRQIGLGATVLVLGLAMVMVSVDRSSTSLFFGGSAVLASGWGLMNASTYRSLLAMAEPGRRAELLTAVYIVSYLAFSVPSVLAGIATDHIGLRTTTLIFGCCTAVLAVLAGAGLVTFERGATNPAIARTVVERASDPCRHVDCSN
jgi:MFS family permease